MPSFPDWGSGHIIDIIRYLEREYNVPSVHLIDAEVKLDVLCKVLDLTPGQFDRLIAENSPVFRTIKGHAFEVVFKTMMANNDIEVEEVGGDDATDLKMNGHTLQLKTPFGGGTKGHLVSYKTHKTHGAKSENESIEYYHSIEGFADFLVALVTYQPFKVLVLKKEELPRHATDENRILSPFSIAWPNHAGLNAYDRLGIQDFAIDMSSFVPNSGHELLPATSHLLGLKTDVVLNTILRVPNFRIWDMSIRGFACEIYIKDLFHSRNIATYSPTSVRPARGEKSDIALRNASSGRFCYLQVKGVSYNNCLFTSDAPIVAVETQLTRGRVNDHPTQSRLYQIDDFDYLVLGIDPSLARAYRTSQEVSQRLAWEYYAIPSSELRSHPKYPTRLNSIQRFRYGDLAPYQLNDTWLNNWSEIGDNDSTQLSMFSSLTETEAFVLQNGQSSS